MFKQKKFILAIATLGLLSFSNKVEARWPWQSDPATQKYQSVHESTGTKLERTIKRALNPCTAGLCTSPEGFENCLAEATPFGEFMNSDKFIAKDPDTKIIKTRNVVRLIKVDPVTGEIETKEEKISLINKKAHKAFLDGIRANPNCFIRFCQDNCLEVRRLSDTDITNHMIFLKRDNQLPITFEQRVYTPSELKNRAADDDAWLRMVAQADLIKIKNDRITRLCSDVTEKARIHRMMCAECPRAVPDSNVNFQCTRFDPTQDVDRDKNLQDLMEEEENKAKAAELEEKGKQMAAQGMGGALSGLTENAVTYFSNAAGNVVKDGLSQINQSIGTSV